MKKNKKLPRALWLIVYIVIVLTITVIAYIKIELPAIPLQPMQIKSTPQRLARGKYLFNNVAGCMECHSHRNENLFSMPVAKETIGEGGKIFDESEGLPGSFVAKNLTPYHLREWTDAALFRAITSGVGKDGKALFPLMPYLHFGQADKEDIFSIITYMRTLHSIKNDPPFSHAGFPMNILINTIPQKPDFHTVPDKKDSVAYGAYLVNLGSCITCHSREDKGKLIAGSEFGGGREFPLPTGGTVRSANITPDPETGIGAWSKESFVQRFRSYGDSSFRPATITKATFNTVMPWTNFGQMTREDLAAIYDYLRTVKPVKNAIIKFSKKHA